LISTARIMLVSVFMNVHVSALNICLLYKLFCIVLGSIFSILFYSKSDNLELRWLSSEIPLCLLPPSSGQRSWWWRQ
jgi:hypothetical protein